MKRKRENCFPPGKRTISRNTIHGSLNACSSTNMTKKKNEQHLRNWLELPWDIMVLIFQKLGIVRMLTEAQPVCSLWRNIAKDPIFYRHILLQGSGDHDDEDPLVPAVDAIKFALFAVDRSCGQMARFSCNVMMTPFRIHHLHYIAASSTSCMKSLRLRYCPYPTSLELVEVVKKIPSLEDLQLYVKMFPKGAIEEIGRCCPKLKYLQLETSPFNCDLPSEEAAIAIAENMPNLRRLCLLNMGIRNRLTDIGLQAIIDGCPRLEYIFLSQHPNIDLECDLLKKRVLRLQNIKILSTNPPKNEYEFHLDISDDVRSQVCDYDLDFSNDYLPYVYVEYRHMIPSIDFDCACGLNQDSWLVCGCGVI